MKELEKLSVSSASLFKACPRVYYHREICGWEPEVKPPWLAVGSAYDLLLEKYDIGGLTGAVAAVPELFKDPFAQVDARFILAHYHTKFGHDPLSPIPGGNQFGFGVEYHGNEVTGPTDFKVTGYIDKVSQCGDELVVTERKTTSEPIEENSTYWAKLPLDPQIRCYPWALKTMGHKAGKVVYEVVRKLSTTVGTVYKKDCSLDEYAARLAKHVEKKTLVARRVVYVTDDMCDEFITAMGIVHLDIQRCKARQVELEALGYSGEYAWPMHEGSCSAYGGCNFRDVCENKTTCERGNYSKSSKWLKANGK